MKKTLAIVDPFFAGETFRYVAEELGYEVVAIQSVPFAPQPKKAFAHYFVYDGSLEKLLHSLEQLNVKALFAGNENGVLLADQLSSALGLISNGVELSLARRDKKIMKEQFQKCGVACARFASFDKLDAQTVARQMANFPVVLKPAAAFGSLNVMICRNEDELTSACDLLNCQDLTGYGIVQTHFLAEEYIGGEEYCINVIGNGKQLFVSDIWHYKRKEYVQGRNAYYCAELLDPQSDRKLIQQLVDISLQSVSALGILYGCSHVEVKVDRIPYLIEVGARIAGYRMVQHAEPATGQPVELCHVKAFLGLDFELQPLYTLNAFVVLVHLSTLEEGVIEAIEGVECIKQLPSFKEMTLKVRVGDRISPTVDLVGIPGAVILMSESHEQVIQDCEACHALFQLICCKNSVRTA